MMDAIFRFLTVAWVVVVHFDGSLRPPTDDGTSRMATASATISLSGYNNYDNHRIMLIGGAHLNPSEIKTSGAAEFSGLILALQGILDHQELLASLGESPTIIRVQGDCKTAIHQMQGRAISRKLEKFYQRAHKLVQQIPWKIEFEHCPRESNVLCDRLCYGLMVARQYNIIQSLHKDLDELVQANALQNMGVQRTYETFLAPGQTMIPGWSRLRVYSILAGVAWMQEKYDLLINISQNMQKLASQMRFRTGPHSSLKINADDVDVLHLQGVAYEKEALQKLGSNKKALQVERREKTLLLRHASKVESFKRSLFEDGKSAEKVTAALQEQLQSDLLQLQQGSTVLLAEVERILRDLSELIEIERLEQEQIDELRQHMELLVEGTSCSDIIFKSRWIRIPAESRLQIR